MTQLKYFWYFTWNSTHTVILTPKVEIAQQSVTATFDTISLILVFTGKTKALSFLISTNQIHLNQFYEPCKNQVQYQDKN